MRSYSLLLLVLAFLHRFHALPSRNPVSQRDAHETTTKDVQQDSNFPEITTSSGRYVGHTSSRSPDVIEYLGISYGQSPTGPLRFASPVGFVSNQSFNASLQPPDCPYVARDWGSVPGENYQSAPRIMAQESADGYNPMSEDCLKLNVWAPISANGSQAVLVFLYGGGK